MKNIIRTVFFLVILVFSAGYLAADVKNISRIDRIKAVVNGEIITQGDIDLFLLTGNPGVDKAQMEGYALQRLIQSMLIKQRAKELGIVIPENKLREEAERIKTQYPDVSVKTLMKWVEQEQLGYMIRSQEIAPKITVSPEEVKKYYQMYIHLFQEPAKVLIRNIAVNFNPQMDIEAGVEDIRTTLNEVANLVPKREEKKTIDAFSQKILAFEGEKTELIKESLEFLKGLMASDNRVIKAESTKLYEKYRYFKTEKQAEEICKEIKAKLKQAETGDFQTLVIEHSEGPYRTNGGKWDWFAKDELNAKLKVIEDAAFGLKVNEISDILDAGNTKYIIQKIAEKGAEKRDINSPDVQTEIIRKIMKRKEKAENEKLLSELQKEAYIKIY